ncbi:MAG: right-handed parallel beta-helix repeat-containing protein [Methanobacteriaceae archaeon]|jgi:hypothetical protein|nr:right-handed parallel beta-helix repeat-containing protein [Methanobacteriaceae archaeon]
MKSIKFLFILFFIISLSFGAVSASEDNETYVENQESINDVFSNDLSDDYIESQESVNDVFSNELLDVISYENTISNSVHDVTNDNYGSYFDSSGLKSNVNEGDTLKLNGAFSDKNFNINKAINLVGVNAKLKDSSIIVHTGGSESNISDISIINSANGKNGIFLTGASYCTVNNCDIFVNSTGAFGLVLDDKSNFNKITSNKIHNGLTSENKYHATFVLGDSHNNYIAHNIIKTGDSNGIYLSSYGSGAFKGGESNNNNIFNNTISCYLEGGPTSWNYAIQMIGSNNIARENKIYDVFRGISGSGKNNSVIGNLLSNLRGIDFSTGNVVGGDYGIFGAPDSIIANNTIVNSKLTGAGISVSSNSKVYGNNIELLNNTLGIKAEGNNINVYNNIIKSNGIGVYQMGGANRAGYSGLIIKNNTINSGSSIGILLKKQSNTIYPKNFTIIDNNVITNNPIAIDAAEGDSNSYIIRNNEVHGKKIVTPDGIIDPSEDINFNGTTYNITNSNYNQYFNVDGTLNKTSLKNGDILNFIGDFYNKDMIIDLSVKLTGNKVNFYNSTIKVQSGSVLIENLNILNNNHNLSNQWGIFIDGVYKVVIRNNTINVTDKRAAYAIYVFQSGNVNVYNNNLISSGGNLTYTLLAYGVENSKFINNKVTTIGTGSLYSYEGEQSIGGGNNVPELYKTYGILTIYSSSNIISNNSVKVSSLVNNAYEKNVNGTLYTNSIVGIDLYFDSYDNVIEYNNITVEGKDNYVYGFGVIGAPTNSGEGKYARNNTFAYNKVNVKGYNFATGFISGYHSTANDVIGNEINIVSERLAYGITLEIAQDMNIIDNKVNTSADINYLIEAFDSTNNVIESNHLYGVGKYVYGIAGYKMSNNTIYKNNISALGNNGILNFTNHDAIKQGNSGIFLNQSNGNEIQDNWITTLGNYSVNIANGANNNVSNNYLKSKDKIGDSSVNGSSNNQVHDNYFYYFGGIVFDPIVTIFDEEIVFNVKVNDGGNSNVKFYIGKTYVGQSKAVNGVASYKYKLNETYGIGSYEIKAIISEFNYRTEEATSNLTINKGVLIAEYKDIKSLPGQTVLLTTTVKDKLNNPISGITVEFYRDGNRYIGKNTTGANGVAIFNWKLPSTLTYGKYPISVNISESKNYLANSTSANLYLGNANPVYLSANNVTMFYKDDSRYSATLLDSNHNPFVNKVVIFTINGVSYEKTTDSKGQASIALNLDSGEYKATVKFDGDENYSSVTVENTVLIKPTVTGKDLVKYFRNDSQYYATFYDKQGNILKNTDVEFNINGVFYKRTTDENGVAKLSINLNPKKYTITATNPLTLEKHSNLINVLTTLKSSDLEKFYKGPEKFSVEVLDYQGNPLKNTEVSMNINGVFYKRTTDDKGIASLSINLNPGQYVITVEHPQSGLLISNDITVYPTLYGKNVNMTTSDRKPYEVTLRDTSGKLLPGKNVTININGVFYVRTTGSDGVAKLNINLSPNAYIATAEYEGYKTSNLILIK